MTSIQWQDTLVGLTGSVFALALSRRSDWCARREAFVGLRCRGCSQIVSLGRLAIDKQEMTFSPTCRTVCQGLMDFSKCKRKQKVL